VHRYSTHYKDLHQYIRLVTSAMEVYGKASERGALIAKGRLGFKDSEVGFLIREAAKASARYIELTTLPEYHLILLPSMLAASYAIESSGYMNLNLYQKAIKSLYLYTDTENTIAVYEVLRRPSSLLGEILGRASVTPGKIKTEGWSLQDLLDEVGKDGALAKTAVWKGPSASELSELFVKKYLDTGDFNKAATATYSPLFHAVTGINESLEVNSKDDLIRLLKLDNELTKKKVSLNPLLPLLNEGIFLGLLRLEFPRES
jgi:hypothetical protein